MNLIFATILFLSFILITNFGFIKCLSDVSSTQSIDESATNRSIDESAANRSFGMQPKVSLSRRFNLKRVNVSDVSWADVAGAQRPSSNVIHGHNIRLETQFANNTAMWFYIAQLMSQLVHKQRHSLADNSSSSAQPEIRPRYYNLDQPSATGQPQNSQRPVQTVEIAQNQGVVSNRPKPEVSTVHQVQSKDLQTTKLPVLVEPESQIEIPPTKPESKPSVGPADQISATPVARPLPSSNPETNGTAEVKPVEPQSESTGEISSTAEPELNKAETSQEPQEGSEPTLDIREDQLLPVEGSVVRTGRNGSHNMESEEDLNEVESSGDMKDQSTEQRSADVVKDLSDDSEIESEDNETMSKVSRILESLQELLQDLNDGGNNQSYHPKDGEDNSEKQTLRLFNSDLQKCFSTFSEEANNCSSAQSINATDESLHHQIVKLTWELLEGLKMTGNAEFGPISNGTSARNADDPTFNNKNELSSLLNRTILKLESLNFRSYTASNGGRAAANSSESNGSRAQLFDALHDVQNLFGWTVKLINDHQHIQIQNLSSRFLDDESSDNVTKHRAINFIVKHLNNDEDDNQISELLLKVADKIADETVKIHREIDEYLAHKNVTGNQRHSVNVTQTKTDNDGLNELEFHLKEDVEEALNETVNEGRAAGLTGSALENVLLQFERWMSETYVALCFADYSAQQCQLFAQAVQKSLLFLNDSVTNMLDGQYTTSRPEMLELSGRFHNASNNFGRLVQSHKDLNDSNDELNSESKLAKPDEEIGEVQNKSLAPTTSQSVMARDLILDNEMAFARNNASKDKLQRADLTEDSDSDQLVANIASIVNSSMNIFTTPQSFTSPIYTETASTTYANTIQTTPIYVATTTTYVDTTTPIETTTPSVDTTTPNETTSTYVDTTTTSKQTTTTYADTTTTSKQTTTPYAETSTTPIYGLNTTPYVTPYVDAMYVATSSTSIHNYTSKKYIKNNSIGLDYDTGFIPIFGSVTINHTIDRDEYLQQYHGDSYGGVYHRRQCFGWWDCETRLNEICVRSYHRSYCGCPRNTRRNTATNVCQTPRLLHVLLHDYDFGHSRQRRAAPEIVNPPFCSDKACSNRGQCHVTNGNVTCVCRTWFYGDRCQIDVMSG